MLRQFSFRELPTPVALPPIGALEAVNMDAQVTVRFAAYEFGLEVLLDLVAKPDPARMPVEVQLTASALYLRPPNADLDAFARGVGEVAPAFLLTHIVTLLPVLTGDGYYGPVRVPAQNLRVVWSGEPIASAPGEGPSQSEPA